MTEHTLSGTKREILSLLLREELSARQISDRLSVSGAAVRQHVQTLEAMGIVERRKLLNQTGRPAFLYCLSDQGKRLFPQRYDLLLGLMVRVLRKRDGDEGLRAIIAEAARDLAERLRANLPAGDDEARWRWVLERLETELSWSAEFRDEPSGKRCMVIHHCPFQSVSHELPEVCGTFFAELLHALQSNLSIRHVTGFPKPACCALELRETP